MKTFWSIRTSLGRALAVGLLVAFPAGAATLEDVSAALRAAPAWRASFTQRYLPAGFSTGNTESGSLVLVPPLRLRFEYVGEGGRVFAVDGDVARMVDVDAGTCDALRLDEAAWGRLPLAAILDPGAAREAFAVSRKEGALCLTPRDPVPELAELLVEADASGLPSRVVAVDASGNRNEFTFSSWQSLAKPPADAHFRPALPSEPPCRPDA